MGRIADSAKKELPITWHALSTDPRVGDASLTSIVEEAQAEVFGDVLNDTEEDALQMIVVSYAGKYAALGICKMAIDFWMDVAIQKNTSGTSEIIEWNERIESEKERRQDLIKDILRLEPLVLPLIPTLQARKSAGTPLISSMDVEAITPNPWDLGPIYAPKEA